MLRRPNKRLLFVVICCSLLFSFTGGFYIAKSNSSKKIAQEDKEAMVVNASMEMEMSSRNVGSVAMSDKILSWGLRRNGKGQLPDTDPGAVELLNKYNAKYVGDTSQKKVYLTFDEGYENGYTATILDALKEYNVKAVFFIVGHYLDRETDLVRRMVEEGHYVGNHSDKHPSLPTLSDEDIQKELTDLEHRFQEKYGKQMQFMRPPKGEYSERVLDLATKLNYCTLFWSFAYDDWNVNNVRGKDYVVNKVCDNIHNGAIILLHAVSGDNAEAMSEIITRLKSEGYTFGDPAELLDNNGNQ